MKQQITSEELFLAIRRSGIQLSKNQAIALIGSRTRVEELVARRKIRQTKPGARQNSPWKCNAEDVFRHIPQQF